jgi:ferredoxin--NADP+ reductase
LCLKVLEEIIAPYYNDLRTAIHGNNEEVIQHRKEEEKLSTEEQKQQTVVVIGAGPAGLFAARELASAGVHVIALNRDIKPGGLAEYGIYPTKHKMKDGLRKQFRQILQMPNLDYYGNVMIGQNGDLSLTDLKNMGFKAIMVTAGAQGTKWLGLPGEDIPKGVYHAKDIVYHYNKLPPYSQRPYYIGKKVALVGVGNVMLDITRWLIRTIKVDEVTAVARRGPAEVKFDKKEMEYVIANLDLQALDEELARVTTVMESVGQDPNEAREYIHSALPKALEPVSQTRFRLHFLASPTQILGNSDGQVCGLEIEETKLVRTNGDTKARGTGVKRVMEIDTVIFAIGDRVDEHFGLPVQWNAFVKNPNPSYPVDGISYETYDPEANKPLEGIFVAGWSREASSGLVGIARKDGERGARAALQYLETVTVPTTAAKALKQHLYQLEKPIITKEDIARLEAVEQAEAERQGLEEFKFAGNDEMLEAMGIEIAQKL